MKKIHSKIRDEEKKIKSYKKSIQRKRAHPMGIRRKIDNAESKIQDLRENAKKMLKKERVKEEVNEVISNRGEQGVHVIAPIVSSYLGGKKRN